MSSAREHILARVRAETGDDTLPEDLDAAFEILVESSSARTSHHGLRQFDDVVAEFDERTTEVNTELHYCSKAMLQATIASLVGEASIQVSAEAESLAVGLNSISDGRGEADFALAIAEAAIAETGTLVVNSHDVRSDAMYLFDHLILVLHAKHVVARFEDYWQHFRPADEFIRAIHMISGPSRTADVEQIIQLGAHGPRRLTVIIVDHIK